MKKYEIDAIRCYQAVMFEKRQETFFASRQINNRKPLELELIEDINVVSIKSETDHILIPLTNVSAIYLKSPLKQEQPAKDEAERNRPAVSHPIKKPRVKQSAYRS